MSIKTILLAEKEIDAAFSSNKLKEIGYTQAVWTLLSIAEEHFLKIAKIDSLSNDQLDAYVDTLINSLSYPLRVCFKDSDRKDTMLRKRTH